MAWTNPRTWVSTEVVTALMMNTHIRDNLNYLFSGVGLLGVVNQGLIPHEFGGLASFITVPLTAYPSGAGFDKLAPNTDVVVFDSNSLATGTYVLQAILAVEGGATVTLGLMNLTDAPDTAIVTATSTSGTGQQVASGSISFAAGGATKTYGVKVKGSSASLRYAAWGIRLLRTA